MNLFVLNNTDRFFFFTSQPVTDQVQGSTGDVSLGEDGQGPIFSLDMQNRLAAFLSEHIPAGQTARLTLSGVGETSPR